MNESEEVLFVTTEMSQVVKFAQSVNRVTSSYIPLLADSRLPIRKRIGQPATAATSPPSRPFPRRADHRCSARQELHQS